MAQDRVVVAPADPVARDHVVAGGPQLVGQQREAGDVPVVGMLGDRRLQQDLVTSELSPCQAFRRAGLGGYAQVRARGKFLVVDEDEHGLARNTEHRDR